MKVQFSARLKNQAWRFDPDTGFLRCTAVILCVGILDYIPADLPGIEFPGGVETLQLYVSPEALAEPESLVSLEGTPVVVGHTWQDTNTVGLSCGNVAGTPKIVGLDLLADILVTDAETVRRVMLPEGHPERLQEISSAYDATITLTPGVDKTTGRAYHGLFSSIRYNHSAILPPGMGRAGSSVRIINRNKGPKMEFTRIKLRNGSFVRVANEDVPVVEKDQADTDKEVNNKVDASKLQELLDKLNEINPQIEALTKERDTLTGQLQAIKEQLDAATAPEAVESAAQAMNEERDAAGKVMNAHGLTLDDATRKLRGHALRLAVVNSVRVKNALTPLEADKAAEGVVQGMFSVYLDSPATQAAPTLPAGHQVVNSGNTPVFDLSTNSGRAARAYPGMFPAKGAQK